MTISRGQMERQLRMGGGIMDLSKKGIGGGIIKGVDMGSRTGFFNPVKAVKGAVKGVTKTVKKIAKSDAGKLALAAAAAYYAPGVGIKAAGGLKPFLVGAPTNLTTGKAAFSGLFGTGGQFAPSVGKIATSLFGPTGLTKATSAITGGGGITKLATLGAVSAFLTKTLGMPPEQAEAELARDPSGYLEQYYRNLNPPGNKDPETYEAEVAAFVAANTSEYAAGGRVGFANGSPRFDDIDFDALQDIMPKLELGDDISMRGPDGEIKVKPIPMPELEPEDDISMPGPDGEIKVKPLKGIENLQASVQFELPFGEPLFIVKQGGKFYGVFEQKDGTRLLFPMDKSGSRLALANAGPVLPPDPTQPVNPFGPKPIGPVLPDRMIASNIENDKILEALYEKYIDLGFSPKEAADKAMEEFDRMSMMKTEGRGLAAIGGRMMKAVGDSASMNAMQAAGVEGLPIRQNKAGVKELDLRETGGFIPPVGIKEKEDDIPAMLSNNEFVMTADAVRGMGDGNVELGAQRMYDQMKMLEAGGKV